LTIDVEESIDEDLLECWNSGYDGIPTAEEVVGIIVWYVNEYKT